ncbi:hypothetical protein BC834DRAFT_822737 [Gloeopeniophorella convolvens]|nr:hypothetical protein BC834DRAFT_822737 [Gloeopeniophorella convolvens]
MHTPYNAQRQHIISSLDALLYQLHVLSFLLAPSLVPLLARAAGQFQLSHPGDFGPKRTLRFRFMLIALFNASSLWTHAFDGAPDGRAVVLDFVGMAYTPSRAQLVLLDLTIIALSACAATIAYEVVYAHAVANATARGALDLTPAPARGTPAYTDALAPGAGAVLELRLGLLWRHVRSPPPPPPSDEVRERDRAAVGRSLRLLYEAQREFRPVRRAPARPREEAEAGEGAGERERERRVPGGMDPPEDGG